MLSGVLTVRFYLRRTGLIMFFGWTFLCLPLNCAAEIFWGLPWELRLNGKLISVRSFSSSLPPEAVANALTQPSSPYRNFLAHEGRILLSGFAAGRHEIAEIQEWGSGSHGYVSSLPYRETSLTKSHAAAVTLGAPAAASETLVGSKHKSRHFIPSAEYPGMGVALEIPEQ